MPCLTNRCKIQDKCANYAGNKMPPPKIQNVLSLAPIDGSTVRKPEDCKNFLILNKIGVNNDDR